MRRTLFLHVGLPKTASTALQETVFPALSGLTVRVLPRSDLFDEREDRRAEHRLFANALRRDPSLWRGLGERVWAALDVPADGRSLLVSDEGIGRAGSRPDLLAAHLKAIAALARANGFDRLAVVACIRRQADWLASHYAQTSHRKRGAGQAGFERKVAHTLDPAAGLYGFGTLLRYDLLEEALGEAADEVLVLPMEAMGRDEGAFLRRLTGFLSQPDPAASTKGEGGRRNVRSGDAGWRLRPRAVSLPGGRTLSVPLTGGATIALTPEIERRVAQAYGEANRRLAERTGLPLAELGYAMTPDA